MIRRFFILSALLMPFAGACASSGSGAGSAGGDRNVITAEEIGTANVGTAYEAVRQLRPEFLRSRGTMSMRGGGEQEYAIVYINSMRMGGLEQLRNIRATDVETIRYISASDATTRWGTGHAGGVIEVTLKS